MGDTIRHSTTFVPVNMDGATREGITPDLKDGTVGYRGYNHVQLFLLILVLVRIVLLKLGPVRSKHK